MKTKILAIAFLFLSIIFFKAQARENDILGTWMATDNSVKVLVFKVRNDFRAKVIWFDDKLGSGKPMMSRRDTENPVPAVRNRKIIGMEILSKLKYNADKMIWENGKIYDASSGRTWDSYCVLVGKNLLKVRGYWKYTWIGKSLEFRRVTGD